MVSLSDGGDGATPRGGASRGGGMTPLMRDSLGINIDDGEFDGSGSVRSTGTVAVHEMRAQLAGLPAPRNDFKIVIPDVSDHHVLILLSE